MIPPRSSPLPFARAPRFGIILLRERDKQAFPITYQRLEAAVREEGGALARNRRWQVELSLDKPNSQTPLRLKAAIFDLARTRFPGRDPDRTIEFSAGTMPEVVSQEECRDLVHMLKAYMRRRLSPIKLVR